MKKCSFALFALVMCMSTSAWAEDCTNLDENAEWMTGLKAMKSALESKDYEQVLVAGRTVYTICPNSPIYLYYIAKAQEGKGDIAKARQFIYKATDATAVMETAPQMAQKIWYARYEIDYPERRPEGVAAMKAENDALKADSRALVDAELSQVLARDKKKLYVGTWTGAGIGLTGIAMTIAGGVVLGLNDKDVDVKIESKRSERGEYITGVGSVNKTYTAGLGVLTAGLGFAVAGAIVTGVCGYQYTHLENDIKLSYSLAPNQMSFGVIF